jgi:hypothetical protein
MELDESIPLQNVHPSFLLRVGGICHGMIFAGFYGEPPYLADTFVSLGPDTNSTCTGTKMVAFAHALENEGCFGPHRAWTIDWLVRLMLEILDSDELVLWTDSQKNRQIFASTKSYEKRRETRIHVEFGKI